MPGDGGEQWGRREGREGREGPDTGTCHLVDTNHFPPFALPVTRPPHSPTTITTTTHPPKRSPKSPQDKGPSLGCGKSEKGPFLWIVCGGAWYKRCVGDGDTSPWLVHLLPLALAPPRHTVPSLPSPSPLPGPPHTSPLPASSLGWNPHPSMTHVCARSGGRMGV